MARGWWLLIVMVAGCDRIWGLHAQPAVAAADAPIDVVIDAAAHCPPISFTQMAMGTSNGLIAATGTSDSFAIAIRSDYVVEMIQPPLSGAPMSISAAWTVRSWTSATLDADMSLLLFDMASDKVFRAQKTPGGWSDPTDAVAPFDVRSVGGLALVPGNSTARMITAISDGGFQEFEIDASWGLVGTEYTPLLLGDGGSIADPSLSADGVNLVHAIHGTSHGIYETWRDSLAGRFGGPFQISSVDARTPYMASCSSIYAIDNASGSLVHLTP